MRLCFPNGEHPDRALDGEALSVGSDPSDAISLRASGLLPSHAVFRCRKGSVWLELTAGARPAYVNARPVRERTLLRVGDVVCLDALQIALRDEPGPDNGAPIPATAPTRDEDTDISAHVVLRGVAGPHFGRSFVVGRALLIGRASAAGLRLDGPDIAERHAQVERHDESIALRAISGRRIEVNGVDGTDRLLRAGDQIAIGQHRFVLEAPGLLDKLGEAMTPVAAARGPGYGEFAGTGSAVETPASRSIAIWWLIAAAAVVAAATTGLLLYGPRSGL